MRTLAEKPKNAIGEAGKAIKGNKQGVGALVDHRPEARTLDAVQRIADESPQAKELVGQKNIAQRGSNNTGLPDKLKNGIENLSGYAMDDVKVHYNSARPAQLQAHAYAQGADIHLAPGQEQHLAHEAWHVVQQKQGRVKPTLQLKGAVYVNDDSGLEKEADMMGTKGLGLGTTPHQVNSDRMFATRNVQSQVIQGQWVTVDGTGERLNLRKTDDPDVYQLGADGAKYNVLRRESDGTVVVEKMENPHGDYRYDTYTPYLDWTNTTSGVSVGTPFGGSVSAFHNRGAPKIGSQPASFGGAKLGDKYVDYVSGLRSGGQSDQQIAQALLDLDDTVIASNLQRRAGAMLHITVYLAEEWRKQGAAKIYRACLRLIAQGTRTFNDFLNDFKFINGADDGRVMVARLYDVFRDVVDEGDLPQREQEIYQAMSPAQNDDFSSDDEFREDDRKNLKSKTRLFSDHHQGEKGWGDPWS